MATAKKKRKPVSRRRAFKDKDGGEWIVRALTRKELDYYDEQARAGNAPAGHASLFVGVVENPYEYDHANPEDNLPNYVFNEVVQAIMELSVAPEDSAKERAQDLSETPSD